MSRLRRKVSDGITATLALAAAASAAVLASAPAQRPAPTQDGATITVDVVALDSNGNHVDTLTPSDFSVTVDGVPRRVLWVRHVTRGPGALQEAVRRQATRADALDFAAEPARNVLVVIDEASIRRGAERAVIEAAGILTDRLGMDDHLGIVRVPVATDSQVTLTTDRPEARAALRKVTGQEERPQLLGDEAASAPQPPAGPTPVPAADPGRPGEDATASAAAERARLATERAVSQAPTQDERMSAFNLLSSLHALLEALGASGGRKVLAVFSGGVPTSVSSRVDELAAAALGAHVVIHAFGPQGAFSVGGARSPDALERLAKATGGTFTTLGRKPEKSVERVLTEMSACYVLGIEPAPSDISGRHRALRVDTPGRQITLRVPAWLVPRPDAEDVLPLRAFPASVMDLVEPAPTSVGAARGGRASTREPEDAPVRPRDVELQRLLGRASDYVAGWEREYSLLVAQEHYWQSTRTLRRALRSDLLLIRPSDEEGWISFRDTFEVDGKPVTDREERLQRLFVNPTPEALAEVKGIRGESSRYNIGPVMRNINVPLFPLEFLQDRNLPRFRFKLGGRQGVKGVEALRVTYEETARPTIVRFNEDDDLPASGWFLVDPASGAVVGSRLVFELPDPPAQLAFEVRYQRDEVLGLWVPGEMSEIYSLYRGLRRDAVVTMDARATYSKFRRFRVTTEERIAVPK